MVVAVVVLLCGHWNACAPGRVIMIATVVVVVVVVNASIRMMIDVATIIVILIFMIDAREVL